MARTRLSHPYREIISSSWQEQELWLSLDDALLAAITDPVLAFGIAIHVAEDAGNEFPEVRQAAELLLAQLFPS